MQIVIDIPQSSYDYIKRLSDTESTDYRTSVGLYVAVANGTPLPKGHGRLIDVSKIEKDKIEKDNPIICLTIDDNYIEAISLDYLNDLPTIIEAGEAGEDE